MPTTIKIFNYYEDLLNRRHGEQNQLEKNIQDDTSCVFIYAIKSKFADRTYYRAEFFNETDDAYHVHFNQISLFGHENPKDFEGVGDNISFEELDKEEIDQIIL